MITPIGKTILLIKELGSSILIIHSSKFVLIIIGVALFLIETF